MNYETVSVTLISLHDEYSAGVPKSTNFESALLKFESGYINEICLVWQKKA